MWAFACCSDLATNSKKGTPKNGTRLPPQLVSNFNVLTAGPPLIFLNSHFTLALVSQLSTNMSSRKKSTMSNGKADPRTPQQKVADTRKANKAAQEKKAQEQLNDTLGELYLYIYGHF